MGAEQTSLRDASELSRHILPPGTEIRQLDHEKAPADNGGSFLVTTTLPSYEDILSFDHTDLSKNQAYAKYMQMHKVLVGNKGGAQLEEIHDSLSEERMPYYLSVAGWAAAESAVVRSDIDTARRNTLLDSAVNCWQRGLIAQEYIEAYAPENRIEYALAQRLALNIAIAPLLRGVINNEVSFESCEEAFKNCLNIAQINAVYIQLAANDNNSEALAAHIGFGYECNALLAFNRRLSGTWFAIPSIARADSGYYHPKQTHDLLVVHQKHGTLMSATPVEVKAKPSAKDRNRYDALLIRGKMHLSVEGKYTPDHTLQAIAAVYEKNPSIEDDRIANNATDRFTNMVRDYYAGDILGKLSTRNVIAMFHDGAQVRANHPGLERSIA